MQDGDERGHGKLIKGNSLAIFRKIPQQKYFLSNFTTNLILLTNGLSIQILIKMYSQKFGSL